MKWLLIALIFAAGLIVFAPQKNELGNAQSIAAFQAKALNDTGMYEQIKEGDVRLPPNTRIDVYDGPQGKGYIVVQETPGAIIITDYGPEGRSKVLTRPKTATSTNEVSR